ncbi:MAG TPA: MarR family transcriptional regulator [Gemmatimonadaceae bacterium]|nr:MarR family transcriptional regulator [Gemmatimonadaceae bacterium]
MTKPAASEFVERMGVVLSEDGLPRIAGRIFGLLLVSPDDLSLDELAETLGVSKASVSLDTRRLEQRGLVERVSRPGDRRDYYRVRPDLLSNLMEQRLRRWRRIHETLTEGRRALHGQSTVVDERLADFAEGLDHSILNLASALQRWRATRPTRAAAAGGR